MPVPARKGREVTYVGAALDNEQSAVDSVQWLAPDELGNRLHPIALDLTIQGGGFDS